MGGELCGTLCGFCGMCDADYQGVNADCSQCGEAYHRRPEDDGFLCDACCADRDAAIEAARAITKGAA